MSVFLICLWCAKLQAIVYGCWSTLMSVELRFSLQKVPYWLTIKKGHFWFVRFRTTNSIHSELVWPHIFHRCTFSRVNSKFAINFSFLVVTYVVYLHILCIILRSNVFQLFNLSNISYYRWPSLKLDTFLSAPTSRSNITHAIRVRWFTNPSWVIYILCLQKPCSWNCLGFPPSCPSVVMHVQFDKVNLY